MANGLLQISQTTTIDQLTPLEIGVIGVGAGCLNCSGPHCLARDQRELHLQRRGDGRPEYIPALEFADQRHGLNASLPLSIPKNVAHVSLSYPRSASRELSGLIKLKSRVIGKFNNE